MLDRLIRRLLPLALTLPACMPATADPNLVLIRDVPHIRQKPDFCGEACAAMALRKLGHDTDQDAVFDRSGVSPLLGRGCTTPELAQGLRRIGFDVGPVYAEALAASPRAGLDAAWAGVLTDLKAGIPSILCMRYDTSAKASEHFRLILGHDATRDEVVYHEPAVDGGAYRRMARSRLYRLWPLKYRSDRWTLVRLRLAPKNLNAPRPATTFTDADYAQHIRALRERLPSKRFTIVLEKPFVVVGDEAEATVRRRSVNTIRWAASKLKALYFAKDPLQILDVWLFRDRSSYETNAERLFGEKPGTPYGYYSARHKALVMNISTGGGTLVHELVHPFIEANFPGCPSWFNEGFASLYEQCGERGGRIWGYTNWRLRGLQTALRAQRVPSFEDLCATSSWEFYSRDRGTNYSQARYLCHYLQSKGLLVTYYKAFVAARETDPTGYRTLCKVLEVDDMAGAPRKAWEAYVMGLRFR